VVNIVPLLRAYTLGTLQIERQQHLQYLLIPYIVEPLIRIQHGVVQPGALTDKA